MGGEGTVGLVVADMRPVLTDRANLCSKWCLGSACGHLALGRAEGAGGPCCAVLSDSRFWLRLERRGSCATAALQHCKWPWGSLALGILTICLQLLSKTVQKLLITVVFKWQLRVVACSYTSWPWCCTVLQPHCLQCSAVVSCPKHRECHCYQMVLKLS